VDEVTEAMRVSVGAHIGLLQARLRIPPVPSIRQVVIGPRAALVTAEAAMDGPWPPGTLLLAWEPEIGAGRSFAEEQNDALMGHWRRLSGAASGGAARDGDLLDDEHLYFAGWAASLWHDLPECQRAACTYAPELAGQPEYFAAATEAFLRRPSSLRAAAPSVFAALAHFYLYDPSRWNRGVIAPAA
jgi:hypothetical protein